MPDWVDKIVAKNLSAKADDSIAAQKHAIAVAETPRIESLLRAQMEESVKQFAQAIGGVEGPINSPLNGYTRFRTSQAPWYVVEFCVTQASILFKTTSQKWLEEPCVASDGVIRIRGEFNADPWFDFGGKRMNTIAEVSESLLAPLFESVN